MDDLARWLGEQLDTDERIARAATPGPWRVRDDSVVGDDGKHWPVAYTDSHRAREDCLHIATHDPARVLREIEAKRKALDHYAECARAGKGGVAAYRMAAGAVAMQIAIMALPYADRPGYREEWRP